MKINPLEFKYSNIYEVADILIEVNFQKKEDIEHFNYYYGYHHLSKINNSVDISIYFHTAANNGFINSLKNRKGIKSIYYKTRGNEIALYERFTERAKKESIFPPISFFKGRIAIHGSSFAFKNKSFILIGEPYSGKSTILLSLCRNEGIKFISDDISIINLKEISLYPFLRPIGMRTSTIRQLNMHKSINFEECIHMELDGFKKIVASPLILPIQIQTENLPISSFIFLEKNKTDCKIEKIEINEAYVRLNNNLHIGHISYGDFYDIFQKEKFLKLSHNFSDINKIKNLIINTIND